MTTDSINQQATTQPYGNGSHNKASGPLEGMNIKENADKNEVLSLSNDELLNMKSLVSHSGLSDKYFYSLIKRGMFPKPIKLGRSSRWRKSEYEKWLKERVKQR